MTNNYAPPPLPTPDCILTFNEVRARVGISRSHIHALVARGLFPQPFKLYEGGRNNGWLSSEIDAWMKTRVKTGREDHLARN